MTNERTKHLIVSRFNEDLAWFDVLPMDEFDEIFVYNKGRDDLVIRRDDCRHKIKIIKLVNLGKCDHTYLYHIISNYHRLGDVNVFLPGTADDPVKVFNTLVTMTVSLHTRNSIFVAHEHQQGIRQHFFNLVMNDYQTRDMRNRELEPSKDMQPSGVRPFGFWYLVNFPEIEVKHVSYFGIFAVAREHIHNRTFDSYVNLYRMLNTHKNPEVGHYFERSWLAIFHPVPRENIYSVPDNKFIGLSPDIMKVKEPYTLPKLCEILGLAPSTSSSDSVDSPSSSSRLETA